MITMTEVAPKDFTAELDSSTTKPRRVRHLRDKHRTVVLSVTDVGISHKSVGEFGGRQTALNYNEMALRSNI